LGTKKKPSKFKLLDNQMGLIFRSALPEELEWDNRAEDIALSLDAINTCLLNMLTALDSDTPQTTKGLATHTLSIQESTTIQEPPWLWFTLPELGFPLLTDEYRRPIHPEIEEYMRRYISNDQDWEQLDDEDCWGVNYTDPTAHIRGKIETILHIWGEEPPETEQDEIMKLTPERERFLVPHASRDPKILKDMTQAMTTQGIATIHIPSGPLNMDGAQWHLLKHTLMSDGPNPIGSSLQTELARQLSLDKDKKHRSFSWKLLRTLKNVFHATKYQGDTAITIPPFFQNAGRGTERIWGEANLSSQAMVINWPGLNDEEKTELIPTLSATDDWILLTHPLGTKNKSQPPFADLLRIARADGKCSRHKGWWREGKNELATHSMTTEVWTSTRGRISEATRIILQEALEEENRKDTPSFGSEDLEIIHRSGTQAGLLGIYNFPGSVICHRRIKRPGGHGSWLLQTRRA